jgi:acetyl esterase/lipase
MTNGATANVERDVTFGKGGNSELKLDVYRPAANLKRTAVIHLFGGGFVRGSIEGHYPGCFGLLAERGYVCIAAQYRLAGEAKWPAQIEDVKAAVRWTRANAAYLDIDAAKIAVAGYSAGGHLALFAAGTANRPEFEGTGGNAGAGTELAACIAYYPVTSTRRRADGSPSPLMPPDASEDDYRLASPINYLGAGCPPTLILHGTADQIHYSSSFEAFQRLHDAGVPAELHLLAGLPHIFDRYSEFAAVSTELCDLLLERYVFQPRAYEGSRPAAAIPAAGAG